MAIVPMADAVSGEIASSAEYNKHKANIIDLDSRVTTNTSDVATLNSRTTDTATSPGGIGNQRLADRFGSGVGTGSNVTTGSATSQLTDVRSRISTVESRTTDTATSPGGIGNQRLADRFGTGVGTGSNVTTGDATSQLTDLRSRVSTLESGSSGALGNVVTTSVTASSSQWNSATEVLTNLVGTFTAVNAKKYRVTASFTWQAGTGAEVGGMTASFRLRFANAGSVTSSGTLITAAPTRGDTETAIYRVTVVGEFTATASGTCTVGLFGMNPGGDTNHGLLYGSTSTSGNGLSTNTIAVDRVT